MELESCVRHNLPIVIIVGNNARHGRLARLATATLGEAPAATQLSPTRYDQVAIAMGAMGLHVEGAQVTAS